MSRTRLAYLVLTAGISTSPNAAFTVVEEYPAKHDSTRWVTCGSFE